MEVSVHLWAFGYVLIGSTGEQLLSVELGSTKDECYRNFINRWEKVSKKVEHRVNNKIVEKVIQSMDTGDIDQTLEIVMVGTFFQQKVWEAIRATKPGDKLSYSDIARKINNVAAVRAVGTACGANPIAVIVPCHRVIKSDGKIGEYRWDKNVKQHLLDRESI